MSLSGARRVRLRAAGLGWYEAHGRSFAFRGPRDPYLVLVSEVILQQTQVSRGEPAWLAFTARFRTFEALARAPAAEVLRAWAGLGYNRRALALQRTARLVMERHGGTLPDDLAALEALPGIGPYTARAVAAICFGRAVGPVDTNVRRVLTRLTGGERRVRRDAASAAQLQRLADALVPPDRPADWTAAVMDIGSLFCRPRAPDCPACPLRADCATAQGGGLATNASRRAAKAPRGAEHASRRAAEASARYSASTPYPASRRWLRGRIVDRLRGASAGEWLQVEEPLGDHDGPAIAAALEALARDGLVELDASGRARLPES
ncbi:MAG TPA: hypothetical protein VFW92_03165 [Candidatus Limnocylindrales bacterium]|nr:hypothetical protein [Candidatus Limnocylindrales bacterium]